MVRGEFDVATTLRPPPSVDRNNSIQSDVVVWAIVDGFLLVAILGGNTLTILAVRYSRRLRSIISNLFVLSLAISDMVVGFTIPYHLAFYMGSGLGNNKCFCLLRFFLIILACCVSIWNLIAIAVDRYIAIVYPLHYSRYMTNKVAIILLAVGWSVGTSIAAIPMFWNNWNTAIQCEFDEVLPPWYMAGVITPVFSMVWLCLLIVYWRIWREASKHAKQLRSSYTGPSSDGPSDWKSVQVVLLILGCFSICWLPYFIVACAQIFKFFDESSPVLYKAAFSLAMANSGMNPLIYAWKNTNFRKAFSRLLRCKGPDSHDDLQYSMRTNLHRKSSTLQHQDIINDSLPNYSTPPPLQKINNNILCIDERTLVHQQQHQQQHQNNTNPNIIISSTNDQKISSNTEIERDSNNSNNHCKCKIINKQQQQQQSPTNNQSSNEITMGNIIINKCAILENIENIKIDKLCLNNGNGKCNGSGNGSVNVSENINGNIKKSVSCVINNDSKEKIVCKINLVNEH